MDHREMMESAQAPNGSWWRNPLSYLSARLQEHEDQVFLVLALVIGVLTGLTVVAFILLTERAGIRLYSPQPIGFTIGLSIAPMVGDSAPVYTPVSYAAMGNDKIGEIAQEPVMPPALTCIRGEDKQ